MTNKQFIEWESKAFGYGYGSGEEYTLSALKSFLELCKGEQGSYAYQDLEQSLTPTVAWLMINILCSSYVDTLEYGTSPRYGWLTENGLQLREYVQNKTVGELYELVMGKYDY